MAIREEKAFTGGPGVGELTLRARRRPFSDNTTQPWSPLHRQHHHHRMPGGNRPVAVHSRQVSLIEEYDPNVAVWFKCSVSFACMNEWLLRATATADGAGSWKAQPD